MSVRGGEEKKKRDEEMRMGIRNARVEIRNVE